MQKNKENEKIEANESTLPSIDWLNWAILQQDADELMYYMHGGEWKASRVSFAQPKPLTQNSED